MDSLKLDRFRRLLNRQNTSINLSDSTQQQTPTGLPTQQSTSASNTLSSTKSSGLASSAYTSATLTKSSLSAIAVSPPEHIFKDNPKPAHFIARKLFHDFTELASLRIDTILAQQLEPSISTTLPHQQQPKDSHTNHESAGASGAKSVFKLLQREEDLVYDQVLRALGTASEYCLPSLLEYLLSWHNQQLEAYADTTVPKSDECLISGCGCSVSPEQDSTSISFNQSTEISSQDQQQQQLSSANIPCDQALPAECGCTSPCNIESHSLSNSLSLVSNPTFRSPTPSSPDISGNQISIASSLSVQNQSPSSLATLTQKDKEADCHQQPQAQVQQQSNSAANTSTSTATNASLNSTTLEDSINSSKRLAITKTRALLIEYTFCQALSEIFAKLYLHPGHDDLISQIEDIAFEHFMYKDQLNLHGIDAADVKRLANKYADLVGILAQTRFTSVKRRFFAELAELKLRDPTTHDIQCVCSLLAGMRSFRIKMAPIEEFEASFQFLQQLADYFIEVRHKSIKHALADLFVEILLPLAATVKNEVKIPCLKYFVDTLWTPTLDMCARKKHSSTIFPMVTCLLCLSQRALYLQNWNPFLQMCLSNLKNRDQKMCRIALESLYRLIWIYMIRIKGESNNVTQTRLNSIVDSLFPRGSRQVVPRDTSLVIFVDIIQFIAQERLDFAMRHIIFDLLSVDRSIKVILAPERMNIGLQAFLVIADNLQQKEGEPTMPISIGSASAQQLAQIMHSGTLPASRSSASYLQNQQYEGDTYGARRACPFKMLNDDTAKSIGLHPYYNPIQKSFNEILRALDTQFGRPLMLTSTSANNKELDDMISGDRKLKIELFRTCIASIPRLMPDGMSKADLIDLLSRMTIHIDEQMRKYAFESLQKLVTEFQDWRLDAIEGFTLFLANQIDESHRTLVDGALKMLLQLLISWHSIITSTSSSTNDHDSNTGSNLKSAPVVMIQTGYETISSRNSGLGGQIVARKNRALAEMRLIQNELSNTRFDRLVNVIQKVEGASLVMLCSCHSSTRKLASFLLRECRAILRCYSSWTCMEQFGLRSPEDGDEEDCSVSMKASLSADNLSRITTTSINGLVSSSMTSMNTQAMLSTSISRMCLSSITGNHHHHHQHNSQQQPGDFGNLNSATSSNRHDLYDNDIDNNLADCCSDEENSTLIFWVAVMMLDSNREHEYTLGLSLLRKILPNMPFEKEESLEELDRNIRRMEWDDYPGIHSLVLKRCSSAGTYEVCISLLDHMTPILKHKICTGSNNKPANWLSTHIIALSTQLLTTYEDPTPSSLNIARRLAICCEENSQKLENLSAVMTLYSRRSFSKDAFQWMKCVAKYLCDACPNELPNTIPLLLDMLENGPKQVQRLTLPILYCIMTYVDLNATNSPIDFNGVLVRLYNKCLGTESLWRDAMQIFRLVISKSSSLTNGTTGRCHELPGRTMAFSFDMDSIPLIAKSRLGELGVVPNVQACSATKAQQQQLQHQQSSFVDSQSQ